MASIDGIPIFKPPYARVTAIDMHKGQHLWVAPLGEGPRNHPRLQSLNLPRLGDYLDGESALVTRTLLFVSVWRRDRVTGLPLVPLWAPSGDPAALRKLLYVFDKQSGALLREIEMDGYSAALPMTYSHGSQQYIVVGAARGEVTAILDS
jgi:quinoprotein glucose dehydrogenase